jgi:branched-chain amino acid transport system substrate-binding protein
MMMRTLLSGAAALAVAAAFAATPAHAQIKVATAGPITGEYAAFGEQMKRGAQQAVDDLNAKGGVLGKKLDLAVGDDACDPKQAVSVANKFASDGVVFVDGHFCSSSSIPASKVYTEEGILEITPASTNPKFTDEGSWNTFRTYGKGIADEVKKNANAEGKQETLYEAYTPGERDYSALVSRLKQAGIGVVFIGGYHTETGLIVRQAKEQGLQAQFIGPDSLVSKELWQVGGDAVEGLKFTFPPDPRNNPDAKAVVKEFQDQHYDPEGYTLYTYAAMQIWAEAATKAGTTDAHKVADELKSGGPWPSVLGNIAFDSKGDPKLPGYVYYVWHNGDYKQM